MVEIDEKKTENKTENKPDPGPQTDVVEEEEKPKWEFEQKAITIREMIDLKIPLKEVFEAEGISMPIKWTSLIRIVNHKMVEGKKIDLDTTVMDAIEAYSGCMTTVFL